MQFIMHTDPETGKKTLFPNKTHTPNELIKQGVEEIDIPTDKDGLLGAMQELLDMVYEATDIKAAMLPSAVPGQPREPSYAERSIRFEDQWEKFSLAHKLHFAALACEDARSLVEPDRKNLDPLGFPMKTDPQL